MFHDFSCVVFGMLFDVKSTPAVARFIVKECYEVLKNVKREDFETGDC